ncbi:amidohydrolase family protein [Sphingomonas soli]|uniref:amidohydrolase family protein n=1 Tax=Sphingomonas soli TaxID=266127 RepID=UPI00082F7499|nr:amidohydrolase family protein [Sphingomonas soli]
MSDTAEPPIAAPRIDCHAHIYTADMPLAPDAWHRPPGEATAAQFLAELEAAGVGHGVLAAASLYGTYNDYSLAATRGSPALRTTVIVDPDIGRAAVEAMAGDGAVGIRLQLRNRAIPDLGDPAWSRLLGLVADLGWHVQLHDDLGRLPPVIAAVEHAGAKLVIDHFARPEDMAALDGPAFGAVLDSIGRGRTWVKVSADFRLPSPAVARAAMARLLAAGGTERLLWGSDWPFAGFEQGMTYARALQSYCALLPDEKLRAAIDRTGMAFYFSGDGGAALVPPRETSAIAGMNPPSFPQHGPTTTNPAR